MVNVDMAQLTEYNMAVVFRSLGFGQILSQLARRLLPKHPSPLIMETPNQIPAIVHPDRRIDCQFADRRVRVAEKRGNSRVFSALHYAVSVGAVGL